MVEQGGTVGGDGGVAQAAYDGGESGHGLPEVGHTTPVGQLEEDVVVGDLGGDGLFGEGEGAGFVCEYCIAMVFDAVEECIDGSFFGGVEFDEVVALGYFDTSRPNHGDPVAIGRCRMDVLHNHRHVMVFHGTKDFAVDVGEVVDSDIVAGGIAAVEFLETGQVVGVDGIPIGGVDIPKHVASADAFPKEGELLCIGSISQLVAFAYVGDIVGLFAAGTEKKNRKEDEESGLFHCCWLLEK